MSPRGSRRATPRHFTTEERNAHVAADRQRAAVGRERDDAAIFPTFLRVERRTRVFIARTVTLRDGEHGHAHDGSTGARAAACGAARLGGLARSEEQRDDAALERTGLRHDFDRRPGISCVFVEGGPPSLDAGGSGAPRGQEQRCANAKAVAPGWGRTGRVHHGYTIRLR